MRFEVVEENIVGFLFGHLDEKSRR